MVSHISKLLVLLLLCFSQSGNALDIEKLWLPKSYRGHYVQLVHAATSAEALERCVKVVEGTIDLERSAEGHPIFRILCRQKNHKTYNEMIDGLTYETLTSANYEEVVETELWSHCHAALLSRTEKMMGLKWLTQLPPEADVLEKGKAEFTVDFDAKNMYQQTLQYRATCSVADDSPAELKVQKRQ